MRRCARDGCSGLAAPARKVCLPCYYAARNEQVKIRRRRIHAAVRQYLEAHPCVDCGEKDPVVLQFDHRDPEEKHHAVSDMVSRGRSQKAIFAEIAKCDVRCANCHARRTAAQLGYYT